MKISAEPLMSIYRSAMSSLLTCSYNLSDFDQKVKILIVRRLSRHENIC